MSPLDDGHPYRRLLSEGRLGALRLRNRIVMCPMGDNLAHEDGRPSETSMDYFEARARGGAGLILVGSVAVSWPEGSYNPNQSALSDDRMIPTSRLLRAGCIGMGRRSRPSSPTAASLPSMTSATDVHSGFPRRRSPGRPIR